MPEFILEKWSALQKQEQRALVILTIFLGSLFLYNVGLRPAYLYYLTGKKNLDESQSLYGWLNSKKQLMKSSVVVKPENAENDKSLITMLSESATTFDIIVSRIEPQPEGVLVVVEEGRYSTQIRWLNELVDKEGLNINDLILTKKGDDKANMRLQIDRMK